ncbi:hypothetical protein ACFY96_00560 [Streptomyces massasporeus]
MSPQQLSPSVRRVAIVGGARIPFARSDGPYATASNQQMLIAALGSVVWISPQTRGLARASAALSSVVNAPR